uniref:TERF1-interacting nuclear factor 2 N-terminal domain-containing protein n=1 Tax=Oncorhynchus tshawytscha TaxID=74940 RepID=A0A8C8GRC4_ONCTS
MAPPIRLVSAAMWKVMKQRDVMHYGTLEEFVTSCCETVPGLLTSRHQAKLALGLRSRVCLLERQASNRRAVLLNPGADRKYQS